MRVGFLGDRDSSGPSIGDRAIGLVKLCWRARNIGISGRRARVARRPQQRYLAAALHERRESRLLLNAGPVPSCDKQVLNTP